MIVQSKMMRVAIAAPLHERIPPSSYGGIEVMIYFLIQTLLARGCGVFLTCAGEPDERLKRHPLFEYKVIADRPLREAVECLGERMQLESLLVAQVVDAINEYNPDIVHSHMGPYLIAQEGRLHASTVTTLHMPISGPLETFYKKHSSSHVVSISNSQREPNPHLNYVSTVYNGTETNVTVTIDQDKYLTELGFRPGKYLFWMARFDEHKGAHVAIDVADALGMDLILAGKRSAEHDAYIQKHIEPKMSKLRKNKVQYIGPVNVEEKTILYRNAHSFIFPSLWPEPFGLTTIEALFERCPVVSTSNGALKETNVHGETGYLVDSNCSHKELVRRFVDETKKVPLLQREACRDHALRHFSKEAMCSGYQAVYEQILYERSAQQLLPLEM